MKKFKNISLKTLPNGYALSVEDNDYLYFSEKDLLEGFMYHLGLSEEGYADRETIEDLLTASVVYRSDNGKITKEMLKTKKENESLRKTCDKLKKRIKVLESGGCRKNGKSEIRRLLEGDDDCE